MTKVSTRVMSMGAGRTQEAVMADQRQRALSPQDQDKLKSLSPREQELVLDTLENHPELSFDKALEMLKAFGM